MLDADIFRAYDIRGIAGQQLTEETVALIGQAIGTEAQARGERSIVVGRDGRLSGPSLSQALHAGIAASGCDVIDIGMVPTPVVYFATHVLQTRSGVMLTGSHNPPDNNGLKIVLAGKTLANEGIQHLYTRIIQGDLKTGQGSIRQQDMLSSYMEKILKDVQVQRPLKVVLDCGNGVAGVVAPELLQRFGCEVISLFCEVDGHFPNHHPDPSSLKNLEDLMQAVQQHHADLGLAFDGDGDRLGLVTEQGTVILPDRQLMLFAIDLLSRNPGAEIIYDVKCTRHLDTIIREHGGKPCMWKTGHSFIKEKMQATGDLLAGEMSGHMFFKERWYGFDDGIYAAARLLEIVSKRTESVAEIFMQLPDSVNTPELKLSLADDRKFDFMRLFAEKAVFEGGVMCDIDGVRVDFSDGFGLMRPSNTTPNLIFRFEGDSAEAMQRIQNLFRDQLLALDANLSLPF